MCAGATLLLFLAFQSAAAVKLGITSFGVVWVIWAIQGTFFRKRTWDKHWETWKAEPGNAGSVGSHSVALSPEGIEETSAAGRLWRPWPGISRIAQHKGDLYFYTGSAGAVIVPGRSLPTAPSLEQILDRALEWKSAASPVGQHSAAAGAIVSPPFDLGEEHLYAAAKLSARSFVPKLSTSFGPPSQPSSPLECGPGTSRCRTSYSARSAHSWSSTTSPLHA